MTTAPSPRPAVLDAAREDDGYFGPDSVTWRLFSDPAATPAALAALLMQALNPNMMRLFDQATVVHSDGDGRSERTSRYLETIFFGDRAHADAAAQSVQRMHAHAQWTDPQTGQVLRADEPAWLDWTHNTIVWSVLAAHRQFGLSLTTDDEDAFVREQHVAGRLAGCDPQTLPATSAELDAYIEAQKDWMALTIPAAETSRNLRKPNLRGNPLATWTFVIVQDGVLHLLPDWARLLYGIEGRPMNLRSAARTTRRMLAFARRNKSYERLVGDITRRVDAHPYRKVRARKG